MKPIKLIIQAFGPFVNKEEIDFTRLGHNPLFLINGPTGSGKSTILDAICFALYGRTTGADRDAAQMRCDQSDDKTLTYVTLDFSLGNQAYRVSRSPTQYRAKSRGEGLTEHTGEASLWSLDSAGDATLIVTKKIKAVTDEIENITGLNVDQFRQVMVLPQGKFRELLLADSADREKIFSKLFQTHIYRRIEESLKNRAIKIIADKKDHDSKVKGILISADLDSEDELYVQLENVKLELIAALENKEIKSKALQAALSIKKSAETLLRRYADIEKTKSEIEELKTREVEITHQRELLDYSIKAQKITPINDEYIRIKNECHLLENNIAESISAGEQLKEQYDEAFESLNLAKKEFDTLDELKKELIGLNQLKGVVNELALKVEEESESNKIYLKLESKLHEDKERLNKLGIDIQVLETEEKNIQKELTRLTDKKVELPKLENEYKLLKKLQDNKKYLSDLELQYEQQQCDYRKSVNAFEDNNIQLKHKELSWYAGQAAILANELHVNEPCPVCGSKEHPEPASVDTVSAVSKEDIDLARLQLDRLRVLMQEEHDKLNHLTSLIEAGKTQVDSLEVELGHLSNRDPDELGNQYKRLKNEIKVLEANQSKLSEIHKQIEVCLESIKKENENILISGEQLEAARLNFKLLQAEVTHIEKGLPIQYRDQSVLIHDIDNLEFKIKSVIDGFEKSQLAFDTLKTALAKHEAIHQGLVLRDNSQNKLLLELEKKWKETISKSIFESVDVYNSALMSEEKQEETSQKIRLYDTSLVELNASLNQQLRSLENQHKPDLNIINEDCEICQIQYEKAENSWKEIDARVNQLQSIKNKLKKAHEKTASLEANYAIYGTLSNVANGRTGNNISLQRFVLSVLLDDVLIEASRRLNIMSKGRFKLLRKQDKSKGNKASGLELDVEDAYTGKTRSVSTLSGGESFMAALSLALGLSDVVQAYAGGIKLDTLFIDEGFGSLDQESLDLAIKTLIDLQESGRMIGIISHVSELKEQMSLRLDVLSSKTGSKIKLIAA